MSKINLQVETTNSGEQEKQKEKNGYAQKYR